MEDTLSGAGGRTWNRQRPFGPTDFLTIYGFRPLASHSAITRVCGLDCTFTVAFVLRNASTAMRICPENSPVRRKPAPEDTTKVLTEMLGVKPGELRALFKQELGAERARDLKEQMLAAGLPV